MPARPVHRFGTSDRLFKGAAPGSVDGIEPGAAALFGLSHAAAQAQSVRDASWFCDMAELPARLVDLGDAPSGAAAPVRAILRRGGRPVLLGGAMEDAASFAAAAGGDAPATALLSARLDLEPRRLGTGPKLAIGTHDLLPAGSVSAWRDAGGLIVEAAGGASPGERLAAGISRAAVRLQRAVLVIDLGVLDTGHAAGSQALNVGGLSLLELLDAVRVLTAACEIAALAAVNLAPERDPRGHAELTAAQALGIALARPAARTAA